MAEQPEDEGDDIVIFYQRDDNQPRVDYGDIDKGHVIEGEPDSLIGVVDRAVELAKKYMHCQDILSKMVNDIDDYLDGKEMACDPDTPDEVLEPIERLVQETENYYTYRLHEHDAYDKIHDLLKQYCSKVRDIKRGCLIALMQLEDDSQLAHLLKDLRFIASQLRKMLMDEKPIQPGVVAASQRRKTGIPQKCYDIVPQLFESVRRLCRMQVSVTQQQLSDFLESTSAPIEVTFVPKMASFRRADGKGKNAEAKKRKFIEQFARYKFVHEALEEIFRTAEEQPYLVGKGEKGEEFKPTDAESEKAAAKPLQMHGASAMAAAEPRYTVYIGDLAVGTTEKELFEMFSECGTIQYVVLIRPHDSPLYSGFVRFVHSKSAENALRELKHRDVQLSYKPEPLVQKRTDDTIEIRGLPSDTDESKLRRLCEEYGDIDYVNCDFDKSIDRCTGYVQFKEESSASAALSKLQSKGGFVMMAKMSLMGASAAAPAEPRYTVYIGDLDVGTTEKELFEMFRKCGTIQYVVLTRDSPGGYVRFVHSKSAENALRELKHRDVQLSYRPEPVVQKRTDDTIEIRDLSSDTDESKLRRLCEEYGDIGYVSFRIDRFTHQYIGYVQFKEESSASAALSKLQSKGELVMMAKPRWK